jgi:hypothetical protein
MNSNSIHKTKTDIQVTCFICETVRVCRHCDPELGPQGFLCPTCVPYVAMADDALAKYGKGMCRPGKGMA